MITRETEGPAAGTRRTMLGDLIFFRRRGGGTVIRVSARVWLAYGRVRCRVSSLRGTWTIFARSQTHDELRPNFRKHTLIQS